MESSRQAPGVPFGYLAWFQRAFAAGPGYTLVPGAPRKIPPAFPLSGDAWPAGLPSVRITKRTPEGGSAMATVKPDPSNGGTALTRTAAALAS